jgi:hypothetical protein
MHDYPDYLSVIKLSQVRRTYLEEKNRGITHSPEWEEKMREVNEILEKYMMSQRNP